MNDENPTYTVAQLDMKDVNEFTAKFMKEMCELVESYTDESKPLVLMAILNACAYLVEDEETYSWITEAAKGFVTDMLMINSTMKQNKTVQ